MSLESAALINEERQLLTALEQPNRRWIKAPSIQSPNPAATFESYEYAVSAKGAPEALACLRLFIESTRLNERNGWSVSALPSWSGTTDIRRFCTVSGSVYELFFVWLYRDDGSFSSWGLRVPQNFQDRIKGTTGLDLSSSDKGDLIIEGDTVEKLREFVMLPGNVDVLRHVAEMRARSRRHAWHNPHLAALFPNSDDDSLAETPIDTDQQREIDRIYVDRTVRTRRHQARLRRMAFRHYPPKCHYCGLDVVEVLDTAHLTADRLGGAASVDNVRILCANHHRAFDAGLLAWSDDSDQFFASSESSVV